MKRNISDELARKIASTGGIVGIGYWGEVSCGNITPDGIAQMISIAIKVVGKDHVALGSDFDGAVGTGFDASELAALTAAYKHHKIKSRQRVKTSKAGFI